MLATISGGKHDHEFDWSSFRRRASCGTAEGAGRPAQAVAIGISSGEHPACHDAPVVRSAAVGFAASYVNLFRAVPLVMVLLLWFFLIAALHRDAARFSAGYRSAS